MKYSFFLMLLVCFNLASAQEKVEVNSGRIFDGPNRFRPLVGPPPADNSAYLDVKGSPFFEEDWVKSTLIAQDNSIYQDIFIRLNLLENRVHYLDSTGKELLIGIPLEQIKYTQRSGKKVHFINGSMLRPAKKGWYQLLVNDTLTLLKAVKKTFDQHTSYGSATEYTITTVDTYIVVYNGSEYEVKKPADFLQILPARKAAIEAHIKNSGRLSKEEQLIEIATFCNTVL